MAFADVNYVTEFPQTFSLKGTEIDLENDFNLIGVQDICIYDSLLIFSSADGSGLWSFFSLPNFHYLGKFLTKGQGPNEFMSPPWIGSAKFFRENGNLFAGIYDFQTGRLYQMNVDESLRNKQLSIIELNSSLPRAIFNFVMIDSATFFCREINDVQTQQTRYILENGNKFIPPCLEQLNQAAIRKGEDHNILSTIIKQNYENGLILETPIKLNYLNLYSLDGSFSKTVCIGDKLDKISKIQDKQRWNRIYTFATSCLFANCWGVLYINEDEMTWQTKRKRLSSILLFNWAGEPLAELKLDRCVTAFDIDFINGFLYTVDHKTDTFCKYDVGDVIGKLQ